MKKFLSMLLILALAASVFTACGDKPASSGSTTDAPAASSSEPEPQEPPYDPAVLTGLPKSDDYPEGQRVTAVMVNNISNTSYQQARPQNGLSEADVLIEIKQAIEMCTIYRDILSGTMDAFASVISNNLNIVMKLLTSITIMLTIPTLFASLWGMNVPVPFQNSPWGFLVVCGISLIASIISGIIMFRKKMF